MCVGVEQLGPSAVHQVVAGHTQGRIGRASEGVHRTNTRSEELLVAAADGSSTNREEDTEDRESTEAADGWSDTALEGVGSQGCAGRPEVGEVGDNLPTADLAEAIRLPSWEKDNGDPKDKRGPEAEAARIHQVGHRESREASLRQPCLGEGPLGASA
jgi:hypothetical protein